MRFQPRWNSDMVSYISTLSRCSAVHSPPRPPASRTRRAKAMSSSRSSRTMAWPPSFSYMPRSNSRNCPLAKARGFFVSFTRGMGYMRISISAATGCTTASNQ